MLELRHDGAPIAKRLRHLRRQRVRAQTARVSGPGGLDVPEHRVGSRAQGEETLREGRERRLEARGELEDDAGGGRTGGRRETPPYFRELRRANVPPLRAHHRVQQIVHEQQLLARGGVLRDGLSTPIVALAPKIVAEVRAGEEGARAAPIRQLGDRRA